MQNQTNDVGEFVETPNELENSINDLPEAPSDLLETPNDSENSVSDFVDAPSDFVEAPSDLLESSSDAENSVSDFVKAPSDLLETPKDSENTVSDFVEAPSDLLETSSDSNNNVSDFVDAPNDLLEMPSRIPSLPSQIKPTTLKDARTATTCDKVDLQEIKEYFPTTSFKTVGDLTTHIIKNWKSVFEVDEVESRLVKALAENNVLKDKITMLEATINARNSQIGTLSKELSEARKSNTNLSGTIGTISQEAHQAALKAAQESFTAKVKEIAEKIQDEAEKSMFKTFNQSVVEATKDIYKKLKDDFDGSLFNFYTSKLMTEKEFLESFVELINLNFNTQINS